MHVETLEIDDRPADNFGVRIFIVDPGRVRNTARLDHRREETL